MQKCVAGLFRLMLPLFEGEGGGAGGGGGQGQQGSQGGGSGSQGSQGQQGSQGTGNRGGQGQQGSQGSSTPISLSDDTMVLVDGKPVRYGDHQRTSRETYEREYGQRFSGNLQNALKRLTQNLQRAPQGNGQQGNGQQGNGQQGGQRRGVDVEELLARVADQPFVDGQTLKLLADHGMAPLSTAIGQQQKTIGELVNRLKALEGHHGAQLERNAVGDFNSTVDNAISGLGIDAIAIEELVKDPYLRELARDVYQSYTWKPGEVAKAFPALFKQRYEAGIAHLRKLDAARVTKSKEKKLSFPNLNGDGTPNGQARKKPMSSSELADHIFGERAGANT